MQMPARQHRQRLLWSLLVVAGLYVSLFWFVRTLTGAALLDGSLGVLLGLYVCSHPAANAVDLLFFDRHALRQMTEGWAGLGWLALNLLVLGAGWLDIVVGATRFAGRFA